jgi:hypothetical protein
LARPAKRGIVNSVAPIVIYCASNREGMTFALKPASREQLEAKFGPEARLRSRIFIGHETRGHNDAIHGTFASQVVQLLTGLSEERLKELGDVVFRDSQTDTDLAVRAQAEPIANQ